MALSPEEIEKGIKDLQSKILSLEGSITASAAAKSDPKEVAGIKADLAEARKELRDLKEKLEKAPNPHKDEPAPKPEPPKPPEPKPLGSGFGFYDL